MSHRVSTTTPITTPNRTLAPSEVGSAPSGAPLIRSELSPAQAKLAANHSELPDSYARALESLTQQIHQLRPSLKQGFVPLMALCDSLKAQERTLKSILQEHADEDKTQQLTHALAALLRELDQVLDAVDPASPPAIARLDLEQIRKLCYGLAVCIPDDGDALIDASDRDMRRAAQSITDKLLARAGSLDLSSPDNDAADVLDILNWISRGLSIGLLNPSDEVSLCLQKAVAQIEIWTDDKHGLSTLSEHNLGRCARQLSTVLRYTRSCEPAANGQAPSDHADKLRASITNLCSVSNLERLIRPALHIVSLQNISTLLKDALDRGQIAADDATLQASLERFTILIAGLGNEQLLTPKSIAPLPATRDCRPLVTFCNLVRELGERLSVRAGKFVSPPAWLENAYTRLITAINSDAFKATKTNAVQLVNLLSFVKLCDKLIARDPDKRKAGLGAASHALDDAIAKLIKRLLRSAPTSYVGPGQLIGVLSGIAHFVKHGKLKRTEALDSFCSALLSSMQRTAVDAWNELARSLAPLTLWEIADLGIVSPSELKAALAAIELRTDTTIPAVADAASSEETDQDEWQTSKKTIKAASTHTEIRTEPRLMIKKPPKEKQTDASKINQSAKANAKGKAKQGRDNASVSSAPGNPAQAIAAGDDKALASLLEKQPGFDITQVLEQTLAAELPVGKHVLNAFDSFFTLAEKLQPATARDSIITYFIHHPPETAGLQTLLQQRGYLDSPPDLRTLQRFEGMLNFLRTASDENVRRSAALPEFGRLLLVKDGSRATLLHKVVELGDRRALGRLLSLPAAKSLPLIKDKAGQLPVHAAIALKQSQTAEHLLSHATGPDQAMMTDGIGRLPVTLAIEWKDDIVVDKLLSLDNARLQSNFLDEKSVSPLQLAAFHDNAFAVIKLLSVNTDPNMLLAANIAGYTPLAMAAMQGSTAVVDLLLSQANAGEQLRRKDREDNNVLHQAATNGRSTVVAKLLVRPEAEGLASALNKSGLNALMLAAGVGHARVVDQLLTLPGAPAMLQQTNARAGGNARDIAIKQGKSDIARRLDAFQQKTTADS